MPKLLVTLESKERVMPGIKKFVHNAITNLADAHDAIISSRVIQTHHSNKRRRQEDEINQGDKLYLSTNDLNLPKNRARKLMPKFIGPYTVLEAFKEASAYKLELPQELLDRRINPTFHISRLRRHYPNDSKLFPLRRTQTAYDFGEPDEAEYVIEEIVDHRWNGNDIEFLIRFREVGEKWEPLENAIELVELTTYLALHGVEDWKDLPRFEVPN
jgi:hypothetical protein